MTDIIEKAEQVTKDVIAKHAARVDADGTFPEESMAALARAGLLGILSAPEVGGAGQGFGVAARVVERIARECASTAMITCMHYSATVVIEKLGPEPVRREIAAGRHLGTLAFSEVGSRSQFWAPVSRAEKNGGTVRLTGKKSWVTAAGHADSYVWSSRPAAAPGECTLWLVPRKTPGVSPGGKFNGLGLRGNESTPVTAEGASIPEANRLGDDGAGFDHMLAIGMPIFCLCAAGVAVGLMESATANACQHASGTQFENTGTAIRDLPTVRAYLARMRIATDQARLLTEDAAAAIADGRADAMLRVLECKAAAGESATAVLDLAMRVCGGAAFRKEIGVERRFRDARAGTVMAPTTDHLYEFIGRAICGMPVFEREQK